MKELLNKIDEQQEVKPISFKEFLETTPSGILQSVSDFTYNVHGDKRDDKGRYIPDKYVSHPTIEIFCAKCEKQSLFITYGNSRLLEFLKADYIFYYHCARCEDSPKTFSILLGTSYLINGEIVKIGEYPPFGVPTPSRLISLIGPDRDIFIRGRRAEMQGLGIGAFAYYRRIVENQKNRLITELSKAAKKLGAADDVIEELEAAKQEIQFSKAINNIKHSLPTRLHIKGFNPLTLLHTPLSEGIHDKTDEECLELARSIRIILTEMANNISQVLKDETELNEAVSNLLNRNKT